jgi:hypothetical protein
LAIRNARSSNLSAVRRRGQLAGAMVAALIL